MAKEEQEKQWKQESSQLKKDLKSRPKTIQKREVEIKFGGKKETKAASPDKKGLSSKSQDDFFRKKLGI